MKINIEIDLTPEEAKELMYLPKEETIQDVMNKVYKQAVESNPLLETQAKLFNNIFTNYQATMKND